MSVRGTLLGLGGLAGIAAVFTTGGLSQFFALAAIGAAGLLVLLMSQRQAADHAQLGSLKRRQKKAETTRGAQPQKTIPAKSVDRVGPNPSTQKEDRIERARAAILTVRGDLAISPPPPIEQSQPVQDGVFALSPTVTVVVPCYNEAAFLGATLESVRRQSFTDWECVIVDDASTDISLAEARRFTKADDRFRLVRHKTNGGLSAARNTGLRMARGRYITFLDSDDMLMSDSLLDRLEAFVEAPSTVAGTFCGMRLVPEDTTLGSLPPHENWPDPWVVDFVSAGGECPFNAHAPLLKTAVIRSVGGFREDMRDGAEDWNLWLRVLRLGYSFEPSKWRTAVYRQKRQSMAKTGAERHIQEAQRQVSLAYQPDGSVAGNENAPGQFPEPLPVYQEQLVHARRAVQYAATAVARGDDATATAILTENHVVVDLWMDRHFGFDDTINAGFRRALGLSTREIKELAEELEPLHLTVRNLIAKAESPRPPQAPVSQGNRWDTLFIPQNAAQAVAMLDIAAGLSSGSFAFLNIERVSGSQGVADLVRKTTYSFPNINEWVLQGHQHRNVVVAFPRDAVVEEFIAATVAKGGAAVEVAIAGDEIMRVAQSPDYGHSLDRLEPGDIGEWLAATASAFVASASSGNGPMLWHGSTDPDPDEAFAGDEYPDTRFDASDLERFKDIHRGERCVIIGNGPSLNQLDLRKLKDEFTIGVNGIFYAADQMGFELSYYVVEDTMVMRDNVEAIREYKAGHKFFPSIYRDQVGEAPDVTYFMMDRGYYAPSSPSFCVPRFSTDATQRLYSGQSVTILNLQLAYYMGFQEVVVIGMDFSYTVPEDSKVDGAHILSMGDDPNHFHPDYFGKGKIWKDPKLDRVLANYQLAKLMYEADGRRIVNATPGGKLELFDRVPYDELFV